MNIALHYQMTLRDREGRVVWRSRKLRSYSLVNAWLRLLRGLMNNATENNIKDINGANKNILAPADAGMAIPYMNFVGSSDPGIVVGTGNAAVGMLDYSLASIVADGSGAGQLVRGACTIGMVAAGASQAQLPITRSFSNSSGGTVTVTETGIHAGCKKTGIAPYEYPNILVVRDVLTSPVAVNNGQTLTVTYLFTITV